MRRAGHHRSAAAARVLLFVALLAGVPAAHAAKDVLALTPGTSTVALGKLVRDNSASTTVALLAAIAGPAKRTAVNSAAR